MAIIPITVSVAARDGFQVMTAAAPFIENQALSLQERFGMTLSSVINLETGGVDPLLIDDTEVSVSIHIGNGDYVRSDQLLQLYRDRLQRWFPRWAETAFADIPETVLQRVTCLDSYIKRNPNRIVLTNRLPRSRYIPSWNDNVDPAPPTPEAEGA